MPERELSDKRGAEDAAERGGRKAEASWPLFPKESWDRVAAALDLDPEEVEIACRICRGEPAKVIARRLDMSVRAVREAVTMLHEKLEVSSQTELVLRLAKKHLAAIGRAEDAGAEQSTAGSNQEYPLFPEAAWQDMAASFRLGPRQLQVACGIVRDESEHTIARRLGISDCTVHKHVQNVKNRLRVRSRVEALVRLLENLLLRAEG